MYQAWSAVAPDVDAFPALMDKTGDLLRRPYDWTEEIKQLSIPALLVYGDADSVPPSHAAAFFALLGGGIKDAGWDGSLPTDMRLAILPGLTHYDIFHAHQLAGVVTEFTSWLGATEGADAAACRVQRRRCRPERQASRSSQRAPALELQPVVEIEGLDVRDDLASPGVATSAGHLILPLLHFFAVDVAPAEVSPKECWRSSRRRGSAVTRSQAVRALEGAAAHTLSQPLTASLVA